MSCSKRCSTKINTKEVLDCRTPGLQKVRDQPECGSRPGVSSVSPLHLLTYAVMHKQLKQDDVVMTGI